MENLVSKLSTKLENEVGRHDKITKNIKQEINDSKITIAAIQNEKSEILDKITIEKNTDKLFTKKLNDMGLEITDAKDLIKKNADNHEKLMKSLNDLKHNIKENSITIKKFIEGHNQPHDMHETSQATPFEETSLLEPNHNEESVRMRPSESRSARLLLQVL